MTFSEAMITTVSTFKLLVSLLTDLTQNFFFRNLWWISLLWLDLVDLVVLGGPFAGDDVALLLLYVCHHLVQ